VKWARLAGTDALQYEIWQRSYERTTYRKHYISVAENLFDENDSRTGDGNNEIMYETTDYDDLRVLNPF